MVVIVLLKMIKIKHHSFTGFILQPNSTAMKYFYTCLSSLLISISLFAHTGSDGQMKALSAIRTEANIRIDGEFDEAEWQLATLATDFTTSSPEPGQPSAQKSEVRVLFHLCCIVGRKFKKFIVRTACDVSRRKVRILVRVVSA